MKYIYFLNCIFLLITLGGCSILPVNVGKLEGKVWCNDRYLTKIKGSQRPEFAKSKLEISKNAYEYAVIALLPLQKEDVDTNFHFDTPENVKHLEEFDSERIEGMSRFGFSAKSYLLKKTDGSIELVIAYNGSDSILDYLVQNFSIFLFQNKYARRYLEYVVDRKPDGVNRIVVTGYSLGGGLAAHVTKYSSKYSSDIKQAWLFNPSPRVGDVNSNIDGRIYLLSTKYEVLNKLDRKKLGASDTHTMDTYDLIKSSSIYNHYRWVLAREILQYADAAYWYDDKLTEEESPPMKILRTQTEPCREAKYNAQR